MKTHGKTEYIYKLVQFRLQYKSHGLPKVRKSIWPTVSFVEYSNNAISRVKILRNMLTVVKKSWLNKLLIIKK